MIKTILKKLLPAPKRQQIKARIADTSLRVFSASPRMANLYYGLFSSQFAAEHHAVLSGRYAYFRGEKSGEQALVLLRRNIHRVEKGLIMRPRREVFGAEYIQDTVRAFESCIKKHIGEPTEHKWAHEVLTEYFSAVNTEKNSNVSQAHKHFLSVLNNYPPVEGTQEQSVPYSRHQSPALTLDYQQLGDLFQRRRSVRWYQDKPVEAGKIRQAVKHASLAPSACNRQPFRFFTALEKNKAVEIAKYAMGTAGFADNIPAMIAVVGDLSAYPFERDRHVIYIDGSLAAMQLMLSLETLGLSSCPINWPDMPERDKKISQALNLKAHEKVIMLIAFGYADDNGMIPFSHKKSEDTLIEFVGN